MSVSWDYRGVPPCLNLSFSLIPFYKIFLYKHDHYSSESGSEACVFQPQDLEDLCVLHFWIVVHSRYIVKLTTKNSHHNPSLVNLTHNHISLCPNENNNQVMMPTMIKLSLVQLQIHKFSWVGSCPVVITPSIPFNILENRT